MLKYTFLTDKFYNDYKNCVEIEEKTDRPYIRIKICVDGVWWAIPMRSNIKHKYAIWTDKENKCGIDLSKAVVIEKPEEYLDTTRQPYIRPNEHKEIKKLSEHQVSEKLKKYIKDYKAAKENQRNERNKNIVKCSTLQYFENYI